MKKIIQLIFLIGLSLSLTSGNPFENKVKTDISTVYICNGKYAKKYHYTKDCRGLSNCKASITSLSKEAAQKKGRTLCGYED